MAPLCCALLKLTWTYVDPEMQYRPRNSWSKMIHITSERRRRCPTSPTKPRRTCLCPEGSRNPAVLAVRLGHSRGHTDLGPVALDAGRLSAAHITASTALGLEVFVNLQYSLCVAPEDELGARARPRHQRAPQPCSHRRQGSLGASPFAGAVETPVRQASGGSALLPYCLHQGDHWPSRAIEGSPWSPVTGHKSRSKVGRRRSAPCPPRRGHAVGPRPVPAAEPSTSSTDDAVEQRRAAARLGFPVLSARQRLGFHRFAGCIWMPDDGSRE